MTREQKLENYKNYVESLIKPTGNAGEVVGFNDEILTFDQFTESLEADQKD